VVVAGRCGEVLSRAAEQWIHGESVGLVVCVVGTHGRVAARYYQ